MNLRIGIGAAWRLRQAQVAWPQPDFARSPGAPGLLAYGVLMLGLAALIWSGARTWQAREDWLQANTQLALAQQVLQRARQGAPQASKRESSRLAVPGTAGRALVAGFRPAWGGLFMVLEAAAPLQIQWLSLERDTERSDVRLKGTGQQLQGVVDTVVMLKRQPGWSAVSLSKLSQGDDAGNGLRFEITAHYDPV